MMSKKVEFTGSADTDRAVLYSLDDSDITNMCALNRYFRKEVCNERFWQVRSQMANIPSDGKPDFISWKHWYMIHRQKTSEPKLRILRLEPDINIEMMDDSFTNNIPIRLTNKEFLGLPFRRGDLLMIWSLFAVYLFLVDKVMPDALDVFSLKNRMHASTYTIQLNRAAATIVRKKGIKSYFYAIRTLFEELELDDAKDILVVVLKGLVLDDTYVYKNGELRKV